MSPVVLSRLISSIAKPNAVQLLSALQTRLQTVGPIHVALVAETWFDCKVNDDLISIDNYTLVRLDRNPVQKRKGGGVCCYVRNDVKFNVLKLRNPTEPSLEYMWIRCMVLQRIT